MTVTYEGGKTYELQFDSKTIELNEDQIELIKNYNFEKGTEIKVTFEEIDEKVDELQEKTDGLIFELRQLIENKIL